MLRALGHPSKRWRATQTSNGNRHQGQTDIMPAQACKTARHQHSLVVACCTDVQQSIEARRKEGIAARARVVRPGMPWHCKQKQKPSWRTRVVKDSSKANVLLKRVLNWKSQQGLASTCDLCKDSANLFLQSNLQKNLCLAAGQKKVVWLWRKRSHSCSTRGTEAEGLHDGGRNRTYRETHGSVQMGRIHDGTKSMQWCLAL